MPGPLHGVRVLDLTGVVSGPFATMFLADQGADVLKIEPIGGDITRRSRATIDKGGEFSALFISSNRGKRSLSIDVKSTVGREVLATCWCRISAPAPWSGWGSAPTNCASAIRA
jgi:crotonobetainyl-CoA:carnitine CoA-transferase CaiB-like acyl-CoA transferase